MNRKWTQMNVDGKKRIRRMAFWQFLIFYLRPFAFIGG